MRLGYLATFTWLLLSLSDPFLLLVQAKDYENEWTAEIPGGQERAVQVAAQHGFTLVREMHSLPDHYILKRSDTPHRSRRSAHHHTKRLVEDNRVTFVEQQHAKRRVKRDFLEDFNNERRTADVLEIIPNDPFFKRQWYMDPDEATVGGTRRSDQVTDLGVIGAWNLGYTGANITVCILDDGLERNHTDLVDNYDPESSHDYNDEDKDPTPRYDPTNENKHGTRCGGEIAMAANNGNCGVGIAYNAKIGGIRMLDGTVTDRVEAESLGFNVSHVNIFSASWGPTDDGKHLEKPSTLAQKAIMKGITEGRDGKGVLYAWASGNGGRAQDNCNADGYSSSIYTIAISSGSQKGHSPWYSEKCSSTIATAYSSGTNGEKQIVSTDLRGTCTDRHSGTSAAAPMAAGLLALLLEANPDLTWRDVQHVIVKTSRKSPLDDDEGWYENAAGYCVSLSFGFGLMDALAMVELAEKGKWRNVGPQHICQVEANDGVQFPVTLSSGNFVEVDFTTDGCEGQDNEVNYLEHVVLNLDLDYPERGRISAELQSPGGTNTTLFMERQYDKSNKGFIDWPLMSVHTWGERPQGTWKFRVMDRTGTDLTGQLKKATLILYGTKEQPHHEKQRPVGCSMSEPGTESVNDVVQSLQNLLKSGKASYVREKVKELLRQQKAGFAFGQDVREVKRILESLGIQDSFDDI